MKPACAVSTVATALCSPTAALNSPALAGTGGPNRVDRDTDSASTGGSRSGMPISALPKGPGPDIGSDIGGTSSGLAAPSSTPSQPPGDGPTVGSGGSTGAARPKKKGGRPRKDPRRVMSYITGATQVQELAATLDLHAASLAGNPLLQVAALSKLARLTAGSAGKGDGDSGASAAARPDKPGARTPTSASASIPVSQGTTPAASHGSAEALDQEQAVKAVMTQLLPLILESIPERMQIGELSSCAWSLGKLRQLWGASGDPAIAAEAGRAADVICARLSQDWALQATSATPGQPRDQDRVRDQGRPRDRVRGREQEGERDAPGSLAKAPGAQGSTRKFLGADVSHGCAGPTAPTPTPISVPANALPAATGADASSNGPGPWPPSSPSGLSDTVSSLSPEILAATAGDAAGSAAVAAAAAVPRGPAGHGLVPLWSQAITQDVANLAWGLARAGRGAREYDGAWQWLAGAAGDVLWSGQGREVANLAWAFAATGRLETPVSDNLILALVSTTRGPEVVKQLREEETTALLWALATALGRIRPRGPAAATAAAGATRGAGSSADRELSDLEPPYIPPPVQPLAGPAGDGEAASAGWPASGAEAPGVGQGSDGGVVEATVKRAVDQLGQRACELAAHGKLTGRQVSSLLWSLAVLRDAAGGVQLDESWLQPLSRRAAHTARYMDGQALGNTAWALGKLRFFYGGAFEALSAATLSALMRGQSAGRPVGSRAASAPATTSAAAPSAHDLVQILWGCGRVKHREDRFLEAAQARLLPQIPLLDRWEIAQLATALGSLDFHSAPLFSALCRRAHQLLPPAPRACGGISEHGPHLGGEQRGPGVEGHHGATAVGTGDRKGELSAPQMVSVLWALGRVEHYDSGLVDELCDSLRTRLVELQPREVASVVSALGRLEHPHSGLLAAVEETVAYDISPYSAPDLVALLYGIASTSARAERLFTRAAAVLQHRLRELDPEGVVQLADSFASVNLPDDDLFEEIAALALRRSYKFTRSQMEKLALAFRSLGYDDSDALVESWRSNSGGSGSSGRSRP